MNHLGERIAQMQRCCLDGERRAALVELQGCCVVEKKVASLPKLRARCVAERKIGARLVEEEVSSQA